jgi:hypothetical protein
MKYHQTHVTRFLIIVLMALIGCHIGLTAGRTAVASSVDKATPPLPTLRGEAAIEHLKQTGLYHSLSAAVTAARYQVTIDPTFTQQQKLEDSDAAALDLFGTSVAISGETAVVGARGDDSRGSAYVFARSCGVWSLQQKLLASVRSPGDGFGWSVAISGETVVVGAATASDYRGAVYIFVRSGGVWSQQQRLLASNRSMGDGFGTSVAISGETVVVGSPLGDAAVFSNQGTAHVFVRSGGVWSEQQMLTASDPAGGDRFGDSVAISGETVVVGARGDDSRGSAYVFARSGGVWSLQQKLEASDAAANDSFGNSVVISGETVLVGAVGDDGAAGDNQGSAYVFARSGGVWSEQQKLEASDAAANDSFGNSVAIRGNTIVAGTPGDDGAGGSDQGSAYVFAPAN